MRQLDNSFTAEIQHWLNSPKEQRDIVKGASLLFQIDRNRAIYNSALQRPQKYHDKIEYELRKHLAYRLDGMTRRDVRVMQEEVLPRIAATIEQKESVISTSSELPGAKGVHGRRPDHDQLPESVKALWDFNDTYYQRIKQFYNECLALTDEGAQPCDIYERLKLLDEADKRYRDNLSRYDAYVIGSSEAVEEIKDDPNEVLRKISAARKNLSKWRSKFGNAQSEDDEAKAKAKIQENIDILLEHGAPFADDTIQFLKSIGIRI